MIYEVAEAFKFLKVTGSCKNSGSSFENEQKLSDSLLLDIRTIFHRVGNEGMDEFL